MTSRTIILGWSGGLAIAILAGAVRAQDANATPPPSTGPTQEWHAFSRNSERIYLADISSITRLDDVTTIVVARVSRKPASATNYSYTADEYAYRCDANQVRPGAELEYGEDGVETGRFEGGADWEPIRPDTLDAYVKPMACDGERPNATVWPSIKAFMDGGRGE